MCITVASSLEPPGIPRSEQASGYPRRAVVDAQPQAPSVVAVVVAFAPGEWLEETLAALADQDYPNLQVLVLDTGEGEDTMARIAAVVPDAFVRRVAGNPGFGAAANEALLAVEGAAFYLFCHDDAAPDPDAVRLLVEE